MALDLNKALKNLKTWFVREARVLPWREDPSPYRVWISEIMLQQTQVITVLPFFERFMTRFPTVEVLARAKQESVLQAWSGLGYYSRARNLHAAAKKIVAHGFPRDRAGWEALPGVGPYTAGAILSIAFHQAEPLLDGNVERVFSRIHRLPTRDKTRLWDESREWVLRAKKLDLDPSDINQALMELGATVCKPRGPECDRCPVSKWCEAFKQQDQECYPAKKKKAEVLRVQEKKVFVITEDGRILIEKRTDGKWRKGLWDLPSEIPEVLVPGRLKKKAVVETQYVVTRHKVSRTTEVFDLSKSISDMNISSEGVEYKWWKVSEIIPFAHGSAFKKTLKACVSI